MFYPLYLSSKITGRPRYFMDYLIVILLVLCMFAQANAVSFISQSIHSNLSIIALVYALLLLYPNASYFLKISGGSNDYDYLGMFM